MWSDKMITMDNIHDNHIQVVGFTVVLHQSKFLCGQVYTVLVIIATNQFIEHGRFGDVKRAKWNGKVVAVKYFSSPDRKGNFSEEVRLKICNLAVTFQAHDPKCTVNL